MLYITFSNHLSLLNSRHGCAQTAKLCRLACAGFGCDCLNLEKIATFLFPRHADWHCKGFQANPLGPHAHVDCCDACARQPSALFSRYTAFRSCFPAVSCGKLRLPPCARSRVRAEQEELTSFGGCFSTSPHFVCVFNKYNRILALFLN